MYAFDSRAIFDLLVGLYFCKSSIEGFDEVRGVRSIFMRWKVMQSALTFMACFCFAIAIGILCAEFISPANLDEQVTLEKIVVEPVSYSESIDAGSNSLKQVVHWSLSNTSGEPAILEAVLHRLRVYSCKDFYQSSVASRQY